MVLALTFLWGPRDERSMSQLSIWALTSYFLAVLVLPGILEYTSGRPVASLLGRFSEAPGCNSRLILWSNVLHLIAQKPWFGWGWGELDYAHFITLYPGERFCDILDNAHNLPLHLAVELGLPLALAFCGACMWLVWRAKPWRETNATRQMAWGVLAVIGLHSLLEYPLWYGPFQLAVVLAVWMLHTTSATGVSQVRKRPTARILSALIATVLIAMCAFAAWDYWRISQIYIAPELRHASYREDTLAKIRNSWLFHEQVQFAELTTTTLTSENAAHVRLLALRMLHFSPEPKVVERLIESDTLLGQDEEALFYLQRFKAAFPQAHAQWATKALKRPP
jgi:O-antigen ligase